MRRGSVIRALALFVGFGALSSTVSAQPYSPYSSPRNGPQVDMGFFYEGLSPYGDWVEMRDYGWVWAPRVDYDWRPYTLGQWIWTDDDGWYWDSDERFGWATYHYGRWVDDPYYGWVWVPGYEWAPAWVSWRHGNGYIGWAPLPPRASWTVGIGLRIGGLDIDTFVGARDYAFVPERSFVERGVYRQVVPRTQNITIINVTNNITNYTEVNERIVNRGVPIDSFERDTGRRAPRVRIVDADRLDNARSLRDEVAVYRPRVEAAPQKAPAHGRSLVRGDQPPAQLVERRREFERQRPKDDTITLSAKEAEKDSGQLQREKARQAQREADDRAQDRLQRDKNAAPGGRPDVQTQQDADKQGARDRQQDQDKQRRDQQLLDQQRQEQQKQRDLQRQEQQQQQDKQRRDQQLLDQQRQEQKQREQQQLDQQRQERQQQQDKQRRDQEQLDQQRRDQKQRELQQLERDQQNKSKVKASPSPSPTPTPTPKKDKKNQGDPKPPTRDRR